MIQMDMRQGYPGNADTPLWVEGMSADQGEIVLNSCIMAKYYRISTRSSDIVRVERSAQCAWKGNL